MEPLAAGHDALSVYVHIPFCQAICTYCDFLRMRWEAPASGRYLESLVQEITSAPWQEFPGSCIGTIFFGGGTPSMYRPGDVERILDATASRRPPGDQAEITIECNPGTVDRPALADLVKAGFNRVSFGVQSFDDATLRALGRIHSAAEARRAISDARSAGFPAVSLDLIFGLPGQTESSWQHDLDEAVKLAPDHISLYILMLDGDTVMRREVEAGRLVPADDDTVRRMFGRGIDVLTGAGFRQYEISNFARPGCECRHNLQYWDGGPYIGFGIGAHSYDGRGRWWNVRNLSEYHRCVSAGISPVDDREALTEIQRSIERIMLQLRLAQGLDLEVLPADHAAVILDRIRIIPGDLLEQHDGRWRLTRRGCLVADAVILELTHALQP